MNVPRSLWTSGSGVLSKRLGAENPREARIRANIIDRVRYALPRFARPADAQPHDGGDEPRRVCVGPIRPGIDARGGPVEAMSCSS
jgi:hypothetical protein